MSERMRQSAHEENILSGQAGLQRLVEDMKREIAELRALAAGAKPYGCICPPGAEAGCKGPGCPRQTIQIGR